MATNPYFVISPSTVVSIFGLLHGPDKTVPVPREDWHEATVDVVIPALNEEQYIILCLDSLASQTLKPRRVIMVDDGSSDHTADYALEYADSIGLEMILFKRQAPIGKTPTLKRQAREFDADVELILDGDTILESENYIERIVQELYQGAGIASACGVVLPMRDSDRRARLRAGSVKTFLEKNSDIDITPTGSLWHRFNRAVTNMYRGVLYMFLQRFIYHGQMLFFGSIINPVGCAVAYRREYLRELFDRYEPILGDDLTNSEDIFIGFAMLEQGYRNIQLTDVYARSIEPEVQRLPRQIYMWSSSFLQSCYYFDDLVRSPFKGLARWRHRRREKTGKDAHLIEEMRKAKEQYRQPFGIEYSQKYGRPMGWVLFMSLVEKIFFPAVLILMAVLQMWEPLAVTVIAETILSMMVLIYISAGQRVEMFFKGLVATPIRYASLLFDVVTISRFSFDVWLAKDKRWRK